MFFISILNKNFKKGFMPHLFMNKRIESKDSQTNEGNKIDPLKSNADAAANKASLFSDQSSEKVDMKRDSKGKRDERKDLSNEFFLADLDLEQ
jgi:hypothetical protein